MRNSISIVLGAIGLAIALLLPSFHFSSAIAQMPGTHLIVREEVHGERLEKKGRDYYQMGQFSLAAEAWQAAVRVYQQQGNTISQAKIWSNLALTYQQLGQWTNADRAIANSFELLPSQPSLATDETALAVFAQAWNNQGILQLARGQTQQALQSWQKATDFYIRVEDEIGVRRSQINQTRALVGLGLYPRACTILLPILGFDSLDCQSLTNSILQEKLASLPARLDSIQLSGWQSFGDILRETGKLEESQLVLEAIAKRHADRADAIEGNVLLSLGNTAQAMGNYPEALKFYQEAAATSTAIATQSQLAQLHLSVEIRQWQPVLALLPPIKANLEKLPLSHEKLYAQINFARSLLLLKQSGQARR